jgi:hypothetical protein
VESPVMPEKTLSGGLVEAWFDRACPRFQRSQGHNPQNAQLSSVTFRSDVTDPG